MFLLKKICIYFFVFYSAHRLKLTNVISIKCTQYIELLQGNNLAPYIFKQEQETFSFELNYALADDILPQICQLHRASTLPVVEQNIMVILFHSLNNFSKIYIYLFILCLFILDINYRFFKAISCYF